MDLPCDKFKAIIVLLILGLMAFSAWAWKDCLAWLESSTISYGPQTAEAWGHL